MRLSADDRSPHYDPAIVPRAKVYINGVEQPFVTEVDDEAGWIVRYKTDAAGDPVVEGWPYALVTETVTGAVRIDIDHTL